MWFRYAECMYLYSGWCLEGKIWGLIFASIWVTRLVIIELNTPCYFTSIIIVYIIKVNNFKETKHFIHITYISLSYLCQNIVLLYQFLESTSCKWQVQAGVLWWSLEMLIFAKKEKKAIVGNIWVRPKWTNRQIVIRRAMLLTWLTSKCHNSPDEKQWWACGDVLCLPLLKEAFIHTRCRGKHPVDFPVKILHFQLITQIKRASFGSKRIISVIRVIKHQAISHFH